MRTNPKAKRPYVVSKCLKMRLLFNPKNNQWAMMGGIHGNHFIYEPNVYNARVASHWEGYIKNNHVSIEKMTFKDYSTN